MIRPAEPADLPRLRAIQAATLEEPWPELLEASVGGPPVTLVLEVDDRPTGYALTVPDRPVAYVAEFAVAPDAQGAGHGSRLMSELLARLDGEGYERVRLTTRAGDERVRSFYADHGFEVTERLPGHYDGGDGVLLEREL